MVMGGPSLPYHQVAGSCQQGADTINPLVIYHKHSLMLMHHIINHLSTSAMHVPKRKETCQLVCLQIAKPPTGKETNIFLNFSFEDFGNLLVD